jgi:hypothetical protein
MLNISPQNLSENMDKRKNRLRGTLGKSGWDLEKFKHFIHRSKFKNTEMKYSAPSDLWTSSNSGNVLFVMLWPFYHGLLGCLIGLHSNFISGM